MGLERLAKHLLDTGEVTPDQIEEARRTQGFFGGQIGSHLLKLGFVSEETLGRALSEVTGLPYASAEQLRVIAPEPLATLDAAAVQRFKVCPFELEKRRLRIAVVNPRDALGLHEIRSVTGHEIEPWVTCEFRLYQALERHYRIRSERSRSVTLAPPMRHARDAAPEPRTKPPTTSPLVEVGLDGRPLDAEVSYEDHLSSQADAGDPFAGLESEEPPTPAAPPERPEVPAGKDPLTVLEESLAAATDRDGIAEALLDFCASRASRGALFARTRDGLRGIAARGRAFEGARLDQLTLPVEPSTVFDTALKSRDFFFGVVPPLPPNRDLYTALGGRLPAMAMVLPIVVKDRVAALLYLDDDERPMSHPDIPLMRRVAAKAGLAFEILLLRGKLRKI